MLVVMTEEESNCLCLPCVDLFRRNLEYCFLFQAEVAEAEEEEEDEHRVAIMTRQSLHVGQEREAERQEENKATSEISLLLLGQSKGSAARAKNSPPAPAPPAYTIPTISTPCTTAAMTSPVVPECVICLGEFTADNPRVYTLCRCGENKTHFHYPCLLVWLDQKTICPTCSAELFFQESG